MKYTPRSVVSLIYFLLLLIAIPVSAQNSIALSVNNQTLAYYQNFNVSISIANADAVAALQYDVAFAGNGIEYLNQFTPSVITGFSIVANQISGNKIRVIVFSLNNSALPISTNQLLQLNFKSKYEPGVYSFAIENVIISDSTGGQLSSASVASNVTVQGSKINIISDTIDFGEIPMLSSQQRNLIVKNEGNTNLLINQFTLASPFTILSTLPITITPGETTNIIVEANTSTKINTSTFCSLLTNDISPIRALQKTEIKANVFAINEIYIGNGTGDINTPITINVGIENMESFNGFQFDVLLPQEMTYVANTAIFLNRNSNHSLQASVVSGNKLRVIAFSANNTNFTENSGLVFSFQISANVNSGYFPLQIENPVISNSSLGNIESDSYSGYVIINSPLIAINPSIIDFGRVPINQIKTSSFDINNFGQSNLVISQAVVNSSALSLDVTLPMTIQPSSSSTNSVMFTPQTIGNFNSSINLVHNGSDNVSEIQVIADVFSPNYLLFNDVYTTANSTFTIPILLSHIDNVKGLQFDISIPDQFAFESISLNAALNGFNVSHSNLGNGIYRIVLFNFSNIFLSPQSTSILNLVVTAGPAVPVGQYDFPISNVVISNVSNQNVASESLETGFVFIVENNAPVAQNQNVTTDQDTSLSITLLATDSDSDQLTYSIVSQPSSGTVTQNGNLILYSPNVGYVGSDSFTFSASDGISQSNIATVNIDVQALDANVSEFENIKIYPNPTQDELFIDLQAPCSIVLYDAMGRLVRKQSFSEELKKISMGELAEGVYYLRIILDQMTITKRVIKTN